MRRHKPSLFLSADFYEAVKRQRKASTLHTTPCHLRYFSTIIKLLWNLNRNNDIRKGRKMTVPFTPWRRKYFCSNFSFLVKDIIVVQSSKQYSHQGCDSQNKIGDWDLGTIIPICKKIDRQNRYLCVFLRKGYLSFWYFECFRI